MTLRLSKMSVSSVISWCTFLTACICTSWDCWAVFVEFWLCSDFLSSLLTLFFFMSLGLLSVWTSKGFLVIYYTYFGCLCLDDYLGESWSDNSPSSLIVDNDLLLSFLVCISDSFNSCSCNAVASNPFFFCDYSLLFSSDLLLGLSYLSSCLCVLCYDF